MVGVGEGNGQGKKGLVGRTLTADPSRGHLGFFIPCGGLGETAEHGSGMPQRVREIAECFFSGQLSPIIGDAAQEMRLPSTALACHTDGQEVFVQRKEDSRALESDRYAPK